VRPLRAGGAFSVAPLLDEAVQLAKHPVPCVCVLLDPGHGHLPLHSGDYMETRLWAALFRSNTTQGRQFRFAVYSPLGWRASPGGGP